MNQYADVTVADDGLDSTPLGLTDSQRTMLETQVRELWPRLFAFSQRLAQDRDQAADAVQEALLRALLNLSRLPTPGQFEAWLKVVVRHLVVDEYRRRMRFRPCPAKVEPITESEPAPNLDCHDFTIEQIRAATARLPLKFRSSYELFLAGCSYREIGRRLGVPPATVGTRISRAKVRMRTLLTVEAASPGAPPTIESIAGRPADSLSATGPRPSCFLPPGPELAQPSPA